MPQLREQYLVLKIAEKKDPEAFGKLYDLYIERIHRFIFFKVARKEDAEDLTSQVFLKAWQSLTSQNAPRVYNFRGWIYELARNSVIDFYRKLGRMETLISLDSLGEEEEIPDERQQFVLDQLYASDRAYLADCLKKLKDDHREILVLRFLEEMNVGEIAKIVKKSPGNVRVLIHRGLKALRGVYEARNKAQGTPT